MFVDVNSSIFYLEKLQKGKIFCSIRNANFWFYYLLHLSISRVKDFVYNRIVILKENRK